MPRNIAISGNQRNNSKGQMTKESGKPMFDKKKWRERKYSKKFKVAEWEKKREKAVLNQYYKELRKDPLYSHSLQSKGNDIPNVHTEGIPETDLSTCTNFRSPPFKQSRKKFNSYEAARTEMRRIQDERRKQKEEKLKKKKEIEEQLAQYRKKRAERYKVLSKKNKKGQPVMKGRLQLLYDQIKHSVTSE